MVLAPTAGPRLFLRLRRPNSDKIGLDMRLTRTFGILL